MSLKKISPTTAPPVIVRKERPLTAPTQSVSYSRLRLSFSLQLSHNRACSPVLLRQDPQSHLPRLLFSLTANNERPRHDEHSWPGCGTAGLRSFPQIPAPSNPSRWASMRRSLPLSRTSRCGASRTPSGCSSRREGGLSPGGATQVMLCPKHAAKTADDPGCYRLAFARQHYLLTTTSKPRR
jgi:hypothetical protein